MVPRRAEKNRNAADPPGAASHAIDLRIDGKIFALHANQQFILLDRAHSASPLVSPTHLGEHFHPPITDRFAIGRSAFLRQTEAAGPLHRLPAPWYRRGRFLGSRTPGSSSGISTRRSWDNAC